MTDWYSGETRLSQDLNIGKYTILNLKKWIPVKSANAADYTLYLKTLLTFKEGNELGKIRIMAMREKPNDGTAYHDVTIFNDSGKEFDWIFGQEHWLGEVTKGRPMHWEIWVSNHFAKAKATTRYSKADYR